MLQSISVTATARVLARNVLWNLVGPVAPLVVALFAIPYLVQGLGADRFGILTLGWVVAGYFSLFDLGLGRGLTKLVAQQLGAGRRGEAPTLVWTALGVMGGLGMIGAAVAWAGTPLLVHRGLRIRRRWSTRPFPPFGFSPSPSPR